MLGLENNFIAAGVRSAESGAYVLIVLVAVLGRDVPGRESWGEMYRGENPVLLVGVVAVSTLRQEEFIAHGEQHSPECLCEVGAAALIFCGL